jgi:hypothetical protein
MTIDNQKTVRRIAAEIDYGRRFDEWREPECEDDHGRLMTGFEWLEDVLDIEWVLNSSFEYRSARVLVAFGGPNIWVDFGAKRVELYWWGDEARAYFYHDAMGIDEALEELYECQR